jgi:hypothetical protein
MANHTDGCRFESMNVPKQSKSGGAVQDMESRETAKGVLYLMTLRIA